LGRVVGTLVLAVLAAACGGAAPTASGAMMLELPEERLGADVIEARVATEVEILQSRPIVERVVRTLGLEHDPSLGPDAVAAISSAVHASRRGGSLVIDVAVSLGDLDRAAAVCNALMDAYLASRVDVRIAPIMTELDWLGSQLEALGERPEDEVVRVRLRERAAQLELERVAARGRADARVLEPCRPRVR
jgi:uncharacterized protein involved in exopolysaccharide biosynthesis